MNLPTRVSYVCTDRCAIEFARALGRHFACHVFLSVGLGATESRRADYSMKHLVTTEQRLRNGNLKSPAVKEMANYTLQRVNMLMADGKCVHECGREMSTLWDWFDCSMKEVLLALSKLEVVLV